MKPLLVLGVAGLLSACNATMPITDTGAQQRIDEALKQAQAPKAANRPAAAASAAAPVLPAALPAAVSQSLLPPLQSTLPRAAAAPSEPRFDLVVTDAPIAQVLHAIVADTRYSVLLSPRVGAPMPPAAANAGANGQDAAAAAAAQRRGELLTVHLKNVTVLEALEAVRDTYGYEFTVQGTRIFVEPPEMQTRFYQVNYTLGQRRGVSDLQVVSGASSSGGGGNSGSGNSGGNSGSSGGSSGGNSGSSGGGYGSSQASALSSISKSDLWGEIEDSVRTILGCTIPRYTAGASRSSGAGTSSNRADVSFVGDVQVGDRLRGVDGCADGRAVNVNQMSGTVLVRGMPKELRTIERLLRRMQVNIERQVIIEAKVIDVQLNRDAQQGINWSSFRNGLMRASVGANPALVGAPGTAAAGAVATGASLADLLGAQLVGGVANTAFNAGLGLALQGSQFAALISFLETQGTVHVLSSPRIATLNNQKAVIKVGTEEPFITAITPGSTSLSSSAAVAVPPTLTYQPFFSGISLDVTPQIDERDQVTLHVHALVNSITAKDKPSSTQAGAASVPLAVSSINQTDSVVKTADGTMVVIGGLMMESAGNSRSAVPGAGDVPVAGALFRKGEQSSSKRELVILIKPTVVKMDGDWAEDIAATGQRIQSMRRD